MEYRYLSNVQIIINVKVEIIIDIQDLIEHPAPSAGRIIRGIYPYQPSSGGSKIPDHIMRNAQNRGTWVHESIESEINTGSYEGNWEWESYMEAFHAFNDDHNPKYLASELCVVAPDGRSKGIIDAIAEIDGEIVLIDFKTSASTDHARFELQLSVYAHILSQMEDYETPERLHIVKLGKTGKYKLLHYTYDEVITESAINLYHYLVEKGAIKTKGA